MREGKWGGSAILQQRSWWLGPGWGGRDSERWLHSGCNLRVEPRGFALWGDEKKEVDENKPKVSGLNGWKDRSTTN